MMANYDNMPICEAAIHFKEEISNLDRLNLMPSLSGWPKLGSSYSLQAG